MVDRGDAESRPSAVRRALAIAGRIEVRLVGGSMGPLIRPGALATLVACELDALAPYDVAAYEREGVLVAHLVRRIDRAGPRTSALGRFGLEAPLEAGELLGRIEGLVVGRASFPRCPRPLARCLVRAAACAARARMLPRAIAHEF